MMKHLLGLLFVSVFIITSALVSSPAMAAIEVHNFKSPENEARYQHLIDELRCLVCQNQNIADSNAGLAYDLRQKVYEMIQAGNSDTEILNYMVERYGDFVLYRPPVKGYTLLLWFGPFILLFGAVVLLIRFARQRKDLEVFDEAELQDVRILLKQTSGDPK